MAEKEAKADTTTEADAPKTPEKPAGQLYGVRTALKSAISGSASNKKRFIVKRVKVTKSAERNPRKGMSERAVYTLARRYVKPVDDGQPLPGSLEEDLTTTPDTFFETSPYKTLSRTEALRPASRTENPMGRWSQLEPTQEESQAQESSHERTHEKVPDPTVSVRFKGVRSITSQDPSGMVRQSTNSKKNIRKIDASDSEIETRYAELSKRQQERKSQCTTRPQPFDSSKQERFFEHYHRTQRTWDSQLQTVCKRLGRPAGDSVVTRAEEYREKVEKLTALELATPSEVKYGIRNWGMGLRCSSQFKEVRHYAVHVGNSYTGLWVQLTDNPYKQAEIIRKPNKSPGNYRSFKDSPSLQEKIKRESKRLSEIVPMKEDHLDDLQLVGVNAFKQEYEGFKKCKKPKVVEVNVLEEESQEPEDL